MKHGLPVLPRMSLSERALALISPRRAQRRLYERWRDDIKRTISDRRDRRGSYDGAESTAYNRQWYAPSTDADSELDDANRETLRNRSRDHMRQNAFASHAYDANVVNVIGDSGLRMECKVKADPADLPPAYDGLPRIDEATAVRFRRDMERFVRDWAENCTLDGMSEAQVQRIVEGSAWCDGECFVHRLRDDRPERDYLSALEVVECDRVWTPYDLWNDANVRQGIRYDASGRIVGYYVSKAHPGALNSLTLSSADFTLVPAADMLHRMNVRRAGQTRGEPALAPVINLFRDLYDYVNATIVQAETQACFCAVVEDDTDSDAVFGGDTETDTEGNASVQRERLAPRAIIRVPTGEGKRIHLMQPSTPSGMFDVFVERLLRQLSAATNVPYEILSADFSKTNYSSARAAFEEARAWWRMRRAIMRDQYCKRLWAWLVDEAVAGGWAVAPGYSQRRQAYRRMTVIGAGWRHIDIQKEANGLKTKLETGQITYDFIAAELGMDRDELFDTLESDVAELAARGLVHPMLAKAAQPSTASTESTESTEAPDAPSDENETADEAA